MLPLLSLRDVSVKMFFFCKFSLESDNELLVLEMKKKIGGHCMTSFERESVQKTDLEKLRHSLL